MALGRVTVGCESITTPTHPFYVPQKGWTEAVHLRAGDILVTCNGEYVVVEQVQHELLETPITVYNFEVEDFHTYYVAEDADAEFVLVHNKCYGKQPDNLTPKGAGRRGAFNAAKRDLGIPKTQQPIAIKPNITVGARLFPEKSMISVMGFSFEMMLLDTCLKMERKWDHTLIRQ